MGSRNAVANVQNAFEQERLERIARQKEEWNKISAGMNIDALKKEAPKLTAKPSKPRAPKSKSEGPARRSDRNVGKERPDYRGQQELKLYVEQERHRSKGRARKAGSSSSKGTGKAHRFNAWHPWMPEAPAAAQEAAWEAAVAKAEELDKKGKKAYPKVLGDSMVSGGFWLHQNPVMANHFDNDAVITFTTKDKARPVSTFRYTQAKRNEGELREDAWNVIFKQKRHSVTKEPTGGYGMSGNWKGFAVDNFLHSGDCVVIVPGAKAAGAAFSTSAEVHIFRCWDYASDDSKPANLKQVRYKALPPGTIEDALAAAGIGEAAAAGSGSEAAADGGKEDGEEEEEEAEEQEEQSGSGADDVQQQDQQEEGCSSEDGESEGSTQLEQQQQQQQQTGRKRGRPGSSSQPKTKKQQQKQQQAGAQKGKKAVAARQQVAAAAATAGGSSGGSGKQQGVKRGRRQGEAAAGTAAGGSKQMEKDQAPAAKRHKQQQPKQRSRTAAAAAAAVTAAAAAAEEPEDFCVDWILDTKVEDGQRLYLVRWLGYTEADDSWEPRECFDKAPRSYDWKCPIPDDVPRA